MKAVRNAPNENPIGFSQWLQGSFALSMAGSPCAGRGLGRLSEVTRTGYQFPRDTPWLGGYPGANPFRCERGNAMRCPACGSELAEMAVADLRVDVCRGGCGGIWFDHRELAKVDDREESAGQTLLDIERRPDVQVDHGALRVCPRCGRPHIMTRHFYSPKREVEVDECSRCEGVWLDPGELATIRAQFADAAERQAGFRRYLDRMRQDAEEQMAREFGPPTEGAPAPLPEAEAPDAAHVATLLARVFRLLRSGLG